MRCEIVNKLDELEKIEFIKLSERIEALKELRNSNLQLYISNEEVDSIIQQVNKVEEETNLIIENWWDKIRSKYMSKSECQSELCNSCNL